jgi:hypothetical protein
MAPLSADADIDLIVGIIVPIGSALIVFLTLIITGHYRKLQRDDMEATLKMEMIQRGMSAPEIEQVLAARLGSWSGHRHNRRCREQSQQQEQHQHQHQGTPAAPR